MKCIKKSLLLIIMLFVLSSVMVCAAPVEIIWWSPNWQKPQSEELARAFEAKNPDIKINIQTTVGQGLQNKIAVALRSGSVPDVMDIAIGWNIPYAITGGLMSLNKFIADSNFNIGDFIESAWATAVCDGKVYGIPYRSEALAFIYNKNLYREAGLDPDKPPKTWDELLEYSKKLTIKEKDQYGLGIVGGGEINNMIYRLLPMIWMNGGSILSADYKHCTVNEPAAVEAIKYYTDMFAKYKVAPVSTLQNDGLALRDLFASGKIAQYVSGSYDIAPILEKKPNMDLGYGIIPHPADKDTAVVLGGWNFVIPEQAAHPEEAWRFIQFMSRPENMAKYTVTMPSSKTAMKSPKFQKAELKSFGEMLPYAKATPPVDDWVQICQIFYNNVQKVLLGQLDAQKAMDMADRRIEALLSR